MKSGDERLLKIRRYTFDTGPLFLYFGEDLRAKKLLDEVESWRAEGSTCEPNLAELYYKTCEKMGRETARIRYLSFRRSKVTVFAPNETLSRSAGEHAEMQTQRETLTRRRICNRCRQGNPVHIDHFRSADIRIGIGSYSPDRNDVERF